MTTATEIPEHVIRTVFDLDGGAPGGRLKVAGEPAALSSASSAIDGQRLLSPDQRRAALAWLRRILLDFEALDQHIALVQELYGASFQYSRPRRERRYSEQLPPATTSAEFAYSDRWDESSVIGILDDGFDVLSKATDAELCRLLLNPYALYDLFDVLDDVQPEAWMADLHELASQVLGPIETHSIDATSAPAKAPLARASAEALLSEEFWTRVTSTIAAAVRQAQSSPARSVSLTPKIEPAFASVSDKRFAKYGLSAAVLACAASIAAFWVAFQANSNQHVLQTQLALLEKEGRVGDAPGDHRTGIAFHSGNQPWPSLQELSTMFLDTDEAKENPQRAVSELERAGSPELRALLAELRKRDMQPREIVDYLRSLLKKD